MLVNETEIRVRYSETDRMGYVYYGNYSSYFEVARVETLRNIGVNYKSLEDEGVMLPVLEYKIKYYKPAFYDDELVIKAIIEEMPSVRIKFKYQCYNSKKDLLNEAETTLVFVDIKSNKPCEAPQDVLDNLSEHFKD